jgi:hypothetical protein
MRLFYSLTVFYSRPNFLIPVEVMSMGKKNMLQLNITFTCKSNCIKSVQYQLKNVSQIVKRRIRFIFKSSSHIFME